MAVIIHYWSQPDHVIVSFDSHISLVVDAEQKFPAFTNQSQNGFFTRKMRFVWKLRNGEKEQGLDQDNEEDILAHLERICNQSSKVYDSYPKSGKGFFDKAFYQLDTKRVLAFGRSSFNPRAKRTGLLPLQKCFQWTIRNTFISYDNRFDKSKER